MADINNDRKAILSQGNTTTIPVNSTALIVNATFGTESTTFYQNSFAERISFTIIVVVFLIWICGSNSTLVAVLLKYPVATRPNATIRIILALSDMLMCFQSLNVLISLWFMDSLFNIYFCGIASDIARSNFFFSFMVIATLATERYVYLLRPLKYHSLVKAKFIISFLVTYFTALSVYFLVYGYLYGYVYEVSILSCPVGKPLVKQILLNMCLFVLTPAVIIGFVCVKTQKSIKVFSEQALNINIRKSIRLILLVSHSLILTSLPAFLYRLVTIAFPINIDRRSMLTLGQITFVIMFALSPALNPAIQFFTDADLFIGLLKLFGKNADFSWQREVKAAVNVRKDHC